MSSVEIGRPLHVSSFGKFVPLSTSEENEQQYDERSNSLVTVLKRLFCFVVFPLITLFVLYWNLCVFPCQTLDNTRATFGITTVYDVKDSIPYDDNNISPFPRQSTHQRIRNNQSYSEPLRVVFLGDSLINQAVNFGMKSMIQSHLKDTIVSTNHAIELFSCARDGTGVADLQKRPLKDCTLPLFPDAVILFWHTDVSDYPWNPLSSEPIHYYTRNTTALLSTLIQNVPHVAISSQGMLGEGMGLFGPHASHYRDQALDEYSKINQQLAIDFHIPYIDVRKAFQEETPSTMLFYRGCNTQDGEHPNIRGTRIMSKLFADVLKVWLNA